MITYCLLSGGIDSTTALARAIHDPMRPREWGHTVRAVSIDYGQRHVCEIDAARKIAEYYRVDHEVLPLALPRTLLTDTSLEIPKVSYAEIHGVSPSYVPFRNGSMLSAVTALIAGRHLDPLREGIDSHYNSDVLIYWGAHAEDAANWAYPDCTPEFIGAMANAIYVGTYHKVRMVAPFASMMKHEIVSRAFYLGAPLEMTWSCYNGGEVHCGECATCLARKNAFRLAGVNDLTVYAA
jgi:7-cyano-7-deazaguanine synthase